jgi:hypothetical protein
MPDGRFLSKSIAYSAQVAGLSFEADYLFMRMISHADREGRVPGAPKAIKGMCAPLRDEITPEIIKRALAEMAGQNLILWYAVDGSQFVQFTGFAKHQRGARLDREADSRLPPPSAKGATLIQNLRTAGGVKPERRRSRSTKRRVSEVKRSEVKESKETPTKPTSAPDGAEAGTNGAKPRKKRETWITPFADAWKDMHGGLMSIEPSVRPLKATVDSLGAEEALRRWEIYLDQTPARFANAAKFAATLNEWEAPKPGASARVPAIPVSPEAVARAATLFALGREFKLFKYDGNRAQYKKARDAAAADPRAGSTFAPDLAASKLWEGIDGLADAMAIKEIARRLETARQTTTQPTQPLAATA